MIEWFVALLVIGLVWLVMRARRQKSVSEGFLNQAMLTDPQYRGDGVHAFNERLHRDYPKMPIIKLSGDEEDVFIVHSFAACKKIMADHLNFSSNPFKHDRLIALNTMSRENHDRIIRHIKNGYTQRKAEDVALVIEKIVETRGAELLVDGDVFKWSRRVHMEISLFNSGLGELDDPLVDRFIAFNDAAVRLMAPLGGIGLVPRPGNFFSVIYYCLASIPNVITLISKLGFINTFRLLRPDLVFPGKRPYSHVFDYPELLPLMPEYFSLLFDRLKIARAESPAGCLWLAVQEGGVSSAEAVAVAVQLMVNMTTANALMNLIDRISINQDLVKSGITRGLINESLRLDAALQRNPRRCLNACEIGEFKIPANSLVLLFLGAANVDPDVYQNPSNFQVDRDSSSLTFGFGIHACLGRYLVFEELEIATRWFLSQNLHLKKIKCRERLVDVDVGNFGFSKYILA